MPLLLGPPFFSDYSFLVHHPVNRDDRHFLALAMASDFTIAVAGDVYLREVEVVGPEG
jgi:hypothetical protein